MPGFSYEHGIQTFDTANVSYEEQQFFFFYAVRG
jgi:hypothetical protein